MGLFDKLLGGNLFQGVGDIIDQFKLSPEEKQRFKLEMESMLMQKEQQLEETYRQELTSRADIIKAEMAQGDAYTKRVCTVSVETMKIVKAMDPLGEGK